MEPERLYWWHGRALRLLAERESLSAVELAFVVDAPTVDADRWLRELAAHGLVVHRLVDGVRRWSASVAE